MHKTIPLIAKVTAQFFDSVRDVQKENRLIGIARLILKEHGRQNYRSLLGLFSQVYVNILKIKSLGISETIILIRMKYMCKKGRIKDGRSL